MTSMGTIEKLCNSAWNGKTEDVKAILTRCTKVEVNGLNLRGTPRSHIGSPNSEGQSALYCAARQGHAEIVIELLNFDGVDVDVIASGHGGTPLHGKIILKIYWS